MHVPREEFGIPGLLHFPRGKVKLINLLEYHLYPPPPSLAKQNDPFDLSLANKDINQQSSFAPPPHLPAKIMDRVMACPLPMLIFQI